MDAQLQARGALRRQGPLPPGTGRDCAQRPAAHGDERPLERRSAAEAAQCAQLPRVRGEDRRPRTSRCGVDARFGSLAPCRHGGKQRAEELPRLRAG